MRLCEEVYGPAGSKQVQFPASLCFYGFDMSLASCVADRFEEDSVCDCIFCDLAEGVKCSYRSGDVINAVCGPGGLSFNLAVGHRFGHRVGVCFEGCE